ncbi:MAG: hypothetical protein AB7F23_07060 [Phycisphaerae bacterium]
MIILKQKRRKKAKSRTKLSLNANASRRLPLHPQARRITKIKTIKGYDAAGSYDFITTDQQGNVIYRTSSSSHVVLIKYSCINAA